MKYHLIRLMAERMPDQLNLAERRRFAWQRGLRNLFRPIVDLRKKLRGRKRKDRWVNLVIKTAPIATANSLVPWFEVIAVI